MAFSQTDMLSSKNPFRFIAVGLGLAQYTDVITTIGGINQHGLLIEGNTIVLRTIQNYGFMGFIGGKIIALLIVFGMSAILLKLGFKKSVIALLSTLTIFLGLMAIRNLYLLMLWQ